MIISLLKWKKVDFENGDEAGFFIISILVLLLAVCCLAPVVGAMLDDAEVHEKYAEAQEKVIILQEDIEKLKAEEKDIDELIIEYDNLKQQLEDAQNYIEQHKEHIEKGCSVMKFLLYFGK